MSSAARNVRISRYGAGAMAAHRHDTSSLTLVLSGRYEETIRGRSAWHGPGALLFYPPGELHSQVFETKGALKLSLAPEPVMVDFLAERLPLGEAPAVAAPDVASVGRRMAREVRLGDEYASVALEGLSWELAALFCRHVRGADDEASDKLTRARECIAANLDRPLSVARLASLCDMHPARLTRAFRRAFGMGPAEYQRGLRLKHALRLVTETDATLAEVALVCGFCDQAHFSRAFKALYGCAPNAYRRL